MTKMPGDQWKRIVDSGFVVIVTVLTFLSFFVWWLLTSESDVKSHQTVQIGCFTSPSIRGISEKQSFLVYFQLGIISWKKKKKKTILGLCRCSVDNYSLNPGDLPCQFELLSHTCTMGGGPSSVLFQWRPAFSALWRRGNSVVSVHHINNFWNTRSNLTKFSGQSPQWLRMLCAKLHVGGWELTEISTKNGPPTLSQRWLSALH